MTDTPDSKPATSQVRTALDVPKNAPPISYLPGNVTAQNPSGGALDPRLHSTTKP